MNRVLQPLAFRQANAWPYLVATAAIVAASLWTLAAAPADAMGAAAGWRGGALCALATALGAVPVLVVRGLPQRLADGLLGFGAGVMLAATAFSLVLPGLEAAERIGYGRWGAAALISGGLLLGALALLGLDRVLVDEPVEAHPDTPLVPARVLVFVFAILLHNVPEGMAVGVAAGGHLPGAAGLAMGIALQDVPEGLVVALILAGAGMARAKAVFIGAFSGVVEPAAAVLSAWAVGISAALLPWGLAFAAGAMLTAVAHSVIPESNRHGHGGFATLGLAIGFCLMMALDTALG
ncbi:MULTISPECIES: ZIP family metal transporter [unclassified Pseudoxanthomonas]|uniref:ZIP family metal transporter n=1 Tax=unclassified Pseudoxanthomonas TaxID=2645906 RepID=UPI0016112F61|nr:MULTISPECIES: ZIP family metal transporter [unclassified Pseudoxanthomonas]MBB3277040.1 ZIP family zinc transporter [Pseudoxanthomonas sp. OG2]